MTEQAKIAVIGGSGLYEMDNLTDVREARVQTPFGDPSDALVLGTLSGVRCAFLPRHGRGHVLLPSEINGRANIWALKSLGVERIIAVGAVGSLKESIVPRDFVFPDQLVDETKGRRSSFFGEGVVAHVAFAQPFCEDGNAVLHDEARALGVRCHRGGVYCCMEGPQFSTKAESAMHRMLGYSVIGMTAVPEAKLAREAEICYSLAALITDYDCWKEGEEVSADAVVQTLKANIADARALVERAIRPLASLSRRCPCARALEGAVVTSPGKASPAALKRLELILGKHAAA
ncbi:MAG: S-methyl-5'-thioadenosine phosphorylase [Elusimicrobia bacterium]|nr:S-methyl-5'-thioadenosine phosphorylase [Elusimicrobiota bacterium]